MLVLQLLELLLPEILKELFEKSDFEKETYTKLHDKAFEKGVLASFEFE